MGKRLTVAVVQTMSVLLLAAPALAQPSLVEVARQEKERRASIPEERKARVYTNDDLRGGRGLTTAVSTPQPAEAAPDQPAEATADEPEPEPQRDEAYWRDRITAAREAKARAQVVAAALQNRVDGLWAEFTARDDPLQRATIEQNRLNALDELATTTADIDRLDREIRDIEEEARRAGAPPGWLR